jgi:hypothetical protein
MRLDTFDDIDEVAESEWDGFHIEGTVSEGDEPIECSWDAGDDEGLCVLGRYGCHVWACPLVCEG